jgi:GGDEF domain-containing protein
MLYPVVERSGEAGFFVIVVFRLTFKREKSSAREDYLTGLETAGIFSKWRTAKSSGPVDTAVHAGLIRRRSTINDRFGHAEGDLLQAIARTITGNIRAPTHRRGSRDGGRVLPESDAASVKVSATAPDTY